jgi:hypothetical protein
MIAAGDSTRRGFERDDGNRAHAPHSAHRGDFRHHVGDPRTNGSGHLCHRILDLVPHDRVTGGPSADKLIMVTSKYPFAATTKTRCDREGGASRKDGKLYQELRDLQRCSGAWAIQRRQVRLLKKRAKQLGMSGYSNLTDQRARTGPAIGAPMVSVTNIRIIKNHPAPCHAHHTPWSRQTR